MRPRLEDGLGTRRLLRFPVGVVVDLPGAFRALVGDGDGFWFDSAAPDPARPDRARHYLGAGERVDITAMSSATPVLDTLRAELAGPAPAADDDAPDFRLGLVGWFEYGLRGETLGIPVETDGPGARLLRVDRMLVVDATSGDAELLALGEEWTGELAAWRDRVAADLADLRTRAFGGVETTAIGEGGFRAVAGERASSAAALPGQSAGSAQRERDARATEPAPGLVPRFLDDDARYADEIRACQAAIVEGEAYQLCLTTRVEVPGAAPDPVALLERLRKRSPAHHGGILRIGDTTLVSASPERFLALDRDGRVSTSPIKGTRPRGESTAEDERLRAELLASEKERAENLMIVDLMRNDLSRVCDPGSVAVTSLLSVESYAQVHQLVSTVEGRLSEGNGVVEVLAACFPAGSMTGAPKRRAAELLAEIERRERGVYAGAFGWIGFDGAADLAMVIRSVVIDPVGASVGTGGGITALSVPEEEVAEMHLKAAALIRVLEGL